jgi:hypothetical protein
LDCAILALLIAKPPARQNWLAALLQRLGKLARTPSEAIKVEHDQHVAAAEMVRRATEVSVAAHVLNRMLTLGRRKYVRVV